MLLLNLELIGLGIANSLGKAIRTAFIKKPVQKQKSQLRSLNVVIGYGAFFGILALLALMKL